MVNLLKEYQDMFVRDYKDFKGMVKKNGRNEDRPNAKGQTYKEETKHASTQI